MVNCGGLDSMKTKIIYISGNELFEMGDIRAAFEEVRNTLGLDKDTILFGVPVDEDNALAQPIQTCDSANTFEPEDIEIPVVQDIIPEPIHTAETVQEDPQPEVIPEVVVPEEPIYEEIPVIENIQHVENNEDTVIPILSVLGGTDTNVTPEEEPEQTQYVTDIITEAVEQPDDEIEKQAETLQISIEDVVADQAPVEEEEKEKTLEELLESMTPLGEDILEDTDNNELGIEDMTDTDSDVDFSVSMNDDVTDTDATLAQLANEFAQTQDQIPTTQKNTGNGKISKLKNILPFKKAKRDDSGLMGDLFGWAGIAANDEDFSIPGFFTSAGGQK